MNFDNILYAFDLDETIVFSTRFENKVKHLLEKKSEDIFLDEIKKLNVNIEDVKYENGRIYVNDYNNEIIIPKKSSWVRKKNRIYLLQPDDYLLMDDSLPDKINNSILDLYKKSKYKCIITIRSIKIKDKIKKSLDNLNIDYPNYGLFMYPYKSHSLKAKWKSSILIDLFNKYDFEKIYYFDDNNKLLKKMKGFLNNYPDIMLYKI